MKIMIEKIAATRQEQVQRIIKEYHEKQAKAVNSQGSVVSLGKSVFTSVAADNLQKAPASPLQ